MRKNEQGMRAWGASEEQRELKDNAKHKTGRLTCFVMTCLNSSGKSTRERGREKITPVICRFMNGGELLVLSV